MDITQKFAAVLHRICAESEFDLVGSYKENDDFGSAEAGSHLD
jgi:hypothetical protein